MTEKMRKSYYKLLITPQEKFFQVGISSNKFFVKKKISIITCYYLVLFLKLP